MIEDVIADMERLHRAGPAAREAEMRDRFPALLDALRALAWYADEDNYDGRGAPRRWDEPADGDRARPLDLGQRAYAAFEALDRARR